MKVVHSLVALLFSSIVSAQQVVIMSPLAGTSVSPGKNITVTIGKPDSLSASEEVAVVIAIRSCARDLCAPQVEALGDILYNGPFNPRTNSNQPTQDFNIRIPQSTSNGNALLTVTHFALIGAGPRPWMELKNVSVVVN
ncbi:uncharacterized protein BJ212DRAFT_65931 [Suillus subaureus]|uniref:Uncharacterized protein n=1 Tax=Suillus subaureus TaxID=48587 RepID=A0A9P7ER06_9AGAM|nr:uncharacterized protein BJ212DRAFT_65931 [Suillus subaureus]KAG1827630.1 hypothetical protein BJ212DRAFT_65931 [Suillus subaureus]